MKTLNSWVCCAFGKVFIHNAFPFLSDWATLVTHSLTNSCLPDFMDVTLACEDANSILVEVVSVDAEKRVDISLIQIWKLKFCHKAKFLLTL